MEDIILPVKVKKDEPKINQIDAKSLNQQNKPKPQKKSVNKTIELDNTVACFFDVD